MEMAKQSAEFSCKIAKMKWNKALSLCDKEEVIDAVRL